MIRSSARLVAAIKAYAVSASVCAIWTCTWEQIATIVRPVTPSQSLSLGIINLNCTFPPHALRAQQVIGTMRPVAPPAKLVLLDLFSPTKLPPLPARLAFPVRARLVLAAAASVICAHPACSPAYLVRLNALPVRKGKNSLTKINRDALHVMQGSIKTPKLNNPACGTCTLLFYLPPAISLTFFRLSPFFVSVPFPTGAFLGSINPPVTVPNAERANGDGISKELERLAA